MSADERWQSYLKLRYANLEAEKLTAIKVADAEKMRGDTAIRERDEARAEISKLSKAILDLSPDNNPAIEGSAIDSAINWIKALCAERDRFQESVDYWNRRTGEEHAKRRLAEHRRDSYREALAALADDLAAMVAALEAVQGERP